MGLNYLLNTKDKKNKIIVLPTAAGKSLVIANIAKELNAPVLCLQPTKELLEQNYNKFISYSNKASIYSASMKIKEIGEVTYATIGSIYKKPELFKDFKYIIVDECHLINPRRGTEELKGSMYQEFFENFNIKILGLTATPYRLKAYANQCLLTRMRPKLFHDFLYIYQISSMVEENYWAPLTYILNPFDRTNLVINSNGTNYTDKSITEVISSQSIIDKIIIQAKKLKRQGRKKVLIFAPNISSSNLIAEKLGLDSVSSKTSTVDRETYINDFKCGKTWGIINVNVLSVGFDEQRIDAIIDGQPTLSLAKYYQRIGRGVRIDLSDSPVKKDCIVVDLVGNFDMFGRVEDLEIKQIAGKWCIVSVDTILTNRQLIQPTLKSNNKESKEMDDEIVGFGKFYDKTFKELPAWYLKWVKNNLTETDTNKKLVEYSKLVINK